MGKEKHLKASRFLSFILRHKPEAVGIEIDQFGWANIDELLAGMVRNGTSIDRDILQEIVDTDSKKRYTIQGEFIRANQGHSIDVKVDMDELEPPEVLYHGTAEKYVESINKLGLLRKTRLQVHLSSDLETAKSVGKRHGELAVYLVKSYEMYKDGYKFYKSSNGVWLTSEVPFKYLERM